eukprot:2724897-Pleurochrysis_carterae.AAC.2
MAGPPTYGQQVRGWWPPLSDVATRTRRVLDCCLCCKRKAGRAKLAGVTLCMLAGGALPFDGPHLPEIFRSCCPDLGTTSPQITLLTELIGRCDQYNFSTILPRVISPRRPERCTKGGGGGAPGLACAGARRRWFRWHRLSARGVVGCKCRRIQEDEPDLPGHASPALRELLLKLLHKDPKKRATMDDLRQARSELGWNAGYGGLCPAPPALSFSLPPLRI